MKRKINKKEAGKSSEEELKNQLARSLADYDNLRKRVEREKEEIIKLANVGFFLKLVPIIDNLKKAQACLKDEGLDNILKDLLKVISEEGIENVAAEKDLAFDEKYHEAIDVEYTEDSEKQGLISQVLSEGWRVKDGPVIRPAKVVVFRFRDKN